MIHLILTPKGLKQCLRLVQPRDKLYLSADAAYGIADLSAESRRLLQSLHPARLDQEGCAQLAAALKSSSSVSWY